MIGTTSVRRGALAAALATTAGLLLPAAPAMAAPVEGDLGAFAYGNANQVGCTVAQGPLNEQKTFSSATARRTASAERTFVARNGGVDASRGRVENKTSGVADAARGAFDTVVFTADHLVRVTDLNPFDCKLGAIADSQSSALLDVDRRGKVALEWDRGRAGQIEQIFVQRVGAAGPVVDKIRPKRHGDLTFRVRPGDYNVFVQFQTRVNETDLALGASLTKRADFRVALDYRRTT